MNKSDLGTISCCFINKKQENWSNLLPIAQYSYNSAYHGLIGMTLFQENLGYTPSFLPDLQGHFCSQSAAKLASEIKETQTQLVAHLHSAILDYKKHYDKKESLATRSSLTTWYSFQPRISQLLLLLANFAPASLDLFKLRRRLEPPPSDYPFLGTSASTMFSIVHSS
ncbi:hypothetical protein DSO57_1023943 [Entomophthora muscae]|uniref:Uncharacterized protein n=1 Tax=Entomophthora muscae TaxID=34485 RepID=A0ACC2UC69_9FUNG|nr:hypothetical protein DSO57_1023943 [Entomophthora muscae]